jgi:hypothetical protein
LAVAVANAYSIQPLLVEVGGVLSISSGLVGILPGLIQIGLACGLAFLLPLGDIILARRLLLTVIPMQIAALVLFAADISATIVDISTQTILYSLDAGIRTRLNAVYQVAMFSGTVMWVLVGACWSLGGWFALCALGVVPVVITFIRCWRSVR